LNTRDSLKILLELPVKNSDDLNELKSFGISQDHYDNDMLMTVALFKAALKGSMPAIKYIDDRMGRSPSDKASKLEEIINNIW